MQIKTMADLKRNLNNITFEQVYNNMNKANPEFIPERVRGPRKVLKIQSTGCFIELGRSYENGMGAFWDFPTSKQVKFESQSDGSIMMTVKYGEFDIEGDWIIKYILRQA